MQTKSWPKLALTELNPQLNYYSMVRIIGKIKKAVFYLLYIFFLVLIITSIFFFHSFNVNFGWYCCHTCTSE